MADSIVGPLPWNWPIHLHLSNQSSMGYHKPTLCLSCRRSPPSACFEAAARHLSFTRAAEELGMTQAAVSYQIKLLEERLGGPLFLRGARGRSR